MGLNKFVKKRLKKQTLVLFICVNKFCKVLLLLFMSQFEKLHELNVLINSAAFSNGSMKFSDNDKHFFLDCCNVHTSYQLCHSSY